MEGVRERGRESEEGWMRKWGGEERRKGKGNGEEGRMKK